MRTRTLVVTAIALLAGLTVVGLQAEASPDASQAPWWGPSDPADPEAGWHFRLPVTVENTREHPMEEPIAHVELDIGAALAEAGWNAETVGARTFPTTFTLDEDSLRVLPYRSGFASLTSQTPLPSRFQPGLLSSDEAANYDPSRNPAGTLVFRLDDTLAPGETRDYVVYLAAEQHGDKPAEDAQLPGWAQQGWGTTVYGFTNVAQGRPDGIDVTALFPDTEATVYTFEGVNPQVADLPNHDNPLTVSTDELDRIRLPPRTFFKIEAEAPVLVGSRGQVSDSDPATYGAGAFVPAENGQPTGLSFLVPAYTPTALVTTAETGDATVTIEAADGSTRGEVSLSAARPYARVDLPLEATQANHVRLEADGVPVRVQLAGPMTGTHTSIARGGGPLGTQHLTLAPPGAQLDLRAPDDATVRVLDAGDPGRQLYPFGSVDRTDPADIEAWPPAHPAPPTGANSSWPEDRPVRVLSIDDEQPARPVHAASGPGQPVGHFPLDRELRTHVRGPAVVIGVHDATTVTITEPLDDGTVDERERTVNENGLVAFEPSEDNSAGEARLELSKPATVLPTGTAETYADVLPAHGPHPEAEVGALAFRGALVRIDTIDGAGGRSVTTVGPGQTATFEVEVTNVGDFQGRSLSEEVRLACEQPPTGWRLTGCEDTISLSSGGAYTTTIEVTAEDANPGERFVTAVEARGQTWNVTDQVQVGAVVRESYDVEAWFFEKGGPKQRLQDPFLVEEDTERTVPIVVRNTGTVEDTYRLDLSDPQQGWSLELRRQDEAADSLTLDPGERAVLDLAIDVEEDPSLLETGVELEVVSTTNQLAFDKLRARAQIASELNLTLASPTPVQLVDPGQTTTYPVDVANNGDGVVTVDLNVSSGLPEGWSVDLEADSVTLFPDNRTRLDLTIDVPAGERADERGTVRLTGETQRSSSSDPSAVLTALVRHQHELTGPSEPIPLEPGPTATINVPLVNTGNGPERIHLLGLSQGWSFEAGNATEIPANETATLPVELDTPSDLAPGERNLTLHLSLSRESQANLTVPLDVQPTPRLRADLVDPPPLLPDRSVTLDLTLRADGNVPVAGNLTTTLPEAWNATLDPPRLDLTPGEQARVVAEIQGPPDPGERALATRFVVDDGDARAETEAIVFDVGRPDLALSEPSLSERADGGLLATVQLTNEGDVDARQVTVALVDGEQAVARTTVERLAPGQTIPVAVGDATVDDASGLALAADPEGQLADPDRENNRVELDQQALPFPAVLTALVATGTALAAWRGKR